MPSVLIDDSDRIGEGSRAICFAKRTLEIFDRFGLAEAMVAKGVTWSRGKIFRGVRLLHEFDLLAESDHKQPAFINLQQYHVEAALAGAVEAERLVDLRWRNRLVGIEPEADGALVTIATPEGDYRLRADWVVACDGARSPTRELMGWNSAARLSRTAFIADVKMRAAFPTERWFWFDPPFHDGRSALLHKQPDDIWRIDLSSVLMPIPNTRSGRKSSARASSVCSAMVDFTLEWVSLYRFQCRRLTVSSMAG